MARRAAKFTNLPINQIYHCTESVLSLASCLAQWRLSKPVFVKNSLRISNIECLCPHLTQNHQNQLWYSCGVFAVFLQKVPFFFEVKNVWRYSVSDTFLFVLWLHVSDLNCTIAAGLHRRKYATPRLDIGICLISLLFTPQDCAKSKISHLLEYCAWCHHPADLLAWRLVPLARATFRIFAGFHLLSH